MGATDIDEASGILRIQSRWRGCTPWSCLPGIAQPNQTNHSERVYSMKNYSTSKVFIAACAGMAFFGVTMLSLAPILGPLNETVQGANALPSTMSIGIIVGTILFGPVVDKFGYKWLLIIASIMALAGVQGLARCQAIEWLHASIAMLGFGGGILNGLTNALVSDIYEDDNRGGRLGIL